MVKQTVDHVTPQFKIYESHCLWGQPRSFMLLFKPVMFWPQPPTQTPLLLIPVP